MTTALAIIPKEPIDDLERFIMGMALLYATRPAKSAPEPDGSWFIGETGSTRLTDQRMLRDTPYTPCRGLRS
jgi:hypothetical protein